jgi:hypothetical protein
LEDGGVVTEPPLERNWLQMALRTPAAETMTTMTTTTTTTTTPWRL